MDTKEILLKLRTKSGFSQDELAEKLFVTRQAVSRWENGDTVPNTETLKLLSKLYNVSINTLLGSPRKLICQCCGMPLEDEIISREKDGFMNEDYCKWCYADGTYTYNDMDDLIEVCVKNMVSENFTEEQARSYMKELLPTLDYWKKYDELSDNGQFEEFKKMGKTFVFVSHDLSCISKYCDRVYLLNQGNLFSKVFANDYLDVRNRSHRFHRTTL